MPLVAGEPSFDLNGRSPDTGGDFVPTTSFGLDVGVIMTYKAVTLSLGLDNQFKFRDGLAVRENQLVDPDARPAVVNTTSTWLDAQGTMHISGSVKLDVDLPFYGNATLINETFTIVDSATNSNSASHYVTSEADWSNNAQSSITGYQVGGTAQSVASCLNVPAASQPEVPVMDPHDVANTIATTEKNQFYACNVRYCDPTTAKLTTCDATGNGGLKCTATNLSCTCKDNHADLCGPNNAVIAGTTTGPTYCADQACGGEACFAQSDCSEGICSGGCCQIVK